MSEHVNLVTPSGDVPWMLLSLTLCQQTTAEGWRAAGGAVASSRHRLWASQFPMHDALCTCLELGVDSFAVSQAFQQRVLLVVVG